MHTHQLLSIPGRCINRKNQIVKKRQFLYLNQIVQRKDKAE